MAVEDIKKLIAERESLFYPRLGMLHAEPLEAVVELYGAMLENSNEIGAHIQDMVSGYDFSTEPSDADVIGESSFRRCEDPERNIACAKVFCHDRKYRSLMSPFRQILA